MFPLIKFYCCNILSFFSSSAVFSALKVRCTTDISAEYSFSSTHIIKVTTTISLHWRILSFKKCLKVYYFKGICGMVFFFFWDLRFSCHLYLLPEAILLLGSIILMGWFYFSFIYTLWNFYTIVQIEQVSLAQHNTLSPIISCLL